MGTPIFDNNQLKTNLASPVAQVRTAAFIDLYRPECHAVLGRASYERLRNTAFKSLHDNAKIRAKLDQWLRQFKIQGDTKNDIFQEIFIKFDEALTAQRFLGTSRDGASVDIVTYFLAIGYYLIRNADRRVPRLKWQNHTIDTFESSQKPTKVCREIPVDMQTTDFSALSDNDFVDFADTLDFRVYDEAETQLLAALPSFLSELSEACQNYLKLYYYERLKMKEVAADPRVGASTDQTATNEVARCRRKLRELMSKNPIFRKIKALMR